MDNPPLGNEDGLAGYWKFNSGDGDILYDHSGNQNHGTIEGAIWEEIIEGCSDPLAENYNVNANYDDGSCEYTDNGDYSLSFDGIDDHIYVDDISFDINSSWTFTSWIKPNSIYTIDNAQLASAIFSASWSGSANENASAIFLGRYDSDVTGIQLWRRDEFGGEYNSQNFGSLSIDKWQHVAVVCENNSATFYIDGQQLGI